MIHPQLSQLTLGQKPQSGQQQAPVSGTFPQFNQHISSQAQGLPQNLTQPILGTPYQPLPPMGMQPQTTYGPRGQQQVPIFGTTTTSTWWT